MEIFRDLNIRGSREQVAVLIAEVKRSLTCGWTRNSVIEGSMRSLSTNSSLTYCFSCGKEMGRPSAMIFLTEKEPGHFYVSNVVPQQKHQLSYQEYNGILEEFCEQLIRPHATA